MKERQDCGRDKLKLKRKELLLDSQRNDLENGRFTKLLASNDKSLEIEKIFLKIDPLQWKAAEQLS